jgi:NitT/TauT family transport system permease protein/sulfonate transport system permease protein
MAHLSLNTRRKLAAHIFVAVLFLCWYLGSVWLPDYLLPSPFLVFHRALDFLTVHRLTTHVAASIFHVTAALVLAFLLGTTIAAVSRYMPVSRLLIGRFAGFLNSFSSIGWALLAILWFGLNDASVIFVIGIIVLPIVIINMQAALDHLDAELLEMARSCTRKWSRVFFAVVLPSLYPFMLATMRLSFGIAWKVALTAELFGGNSGFGFIVNLARQTLDTPEIFTVIALMVAIAYLTDHFLFAPLQRAVTRHYADG